MQYGAERRVRYLHKAGPRPFEKVNFSGILIPAPCSFDGSCVVNHSLFFVLANE